MSSLRVYLPIASHVRCAFSMTRQHKRSAGRDVP
jgi:hypothetical protein